MEEDRETLESSSHSKVLLKHSEKPLEVKQVSWIEAKY